MPFQYTFRSDDITTWDVETRDLIENRDRELELYSTTIDNSFLNLNASNLTSGTVPSARMTGAYTGITGLGTLTSLTIDGPLSPSVFFGDWNQNNEWSGIRGTHGYLLTGNSAGATGVFLRSESATHPVYIGSNNTNTLRVDNTSATVTPSNLSSFTLGNTTFASYSGITGDKGYLLVGNSVGDTAMYLRTSGSGPVYIGEANSNTLQVGNGTATVVGTMNATTFSGSGASLTSLNASNLASGNVPGGRIAGSYTGITRVGTLTALTVNAEMYVTGGGSGYGFYDRSGTGEYFVWYSTGADGFLYSSRLGQNILGFARTTGQMYVYKGVNGSPLYGSYGTFNIYGQSGGWYGIVFPDEATTWMSAANGQYFGCYRNNSTWNFYVINGTFVPSDERYKRDIEPLQHGMNLIREIVPVTYDPLTEDPNDDPEQTVGRTHYGFTTQNILQALTNAGETRDVAIVDIGGPAMEDVEQSDRQYLNHSALIAPMVKAIQELDQRLQQLETV